MLLIRMGIWLAGAATGMTSLFARTTTGNGTNEPWNWCAGNRENP
ncbi:MAG: hypothetical protein AB1894_26945 [Chloroflexota bacterium]